MQCPDGKNIIITSKNPFTVTTPAGWKIKEQVIQTSIPDHSPVFERAFANPVGNDLYSPECSYEIDSVVERPWIKSWIELEPTEPYLVKRQSLLKAGSIWELDGQSYMCGDPDGIYSISECTF